MEKIEDRLENWARYYRTRIKLSCCASVEGRMYRAPWRQWVAQSDIPIPVDIDWKDAEEVESAWRVTNEQSRKLLKFHYMHNMPPGMIARKSGVRLWALSDSIEQAKRDIKKILDIGVSYGIKEKI